MIFEPPHLPLTEGVTYPRQIDLRIILGNECWDTTLEAIVREIATMPQVEAVAILATNDGLGVRERLEAIFASRIIEIHGGNGEGYGLLSFGCPLCGRKVTVRRVSINQYLTGRKTCPGCRHRFFINGFEGDHVILG